MRSYFKKPITKKGWCRPCAQALVLQRKKRKKERKSQEDMQSPGRAISRKSRVLFLAI
jgi:hypothetical protein